MHVIVMYFYVISKHCSPLEVSKSLDLDVTEETLLMTVLNALAV